MIRLVSPHAPFCLVGKPQNFTLGKHNRIKSFQLQTDQGLYFIKIPAKLHRRWHYDLPLGITLEVKGRVDWHPKRDKLKFLIESIRPLDGPEQSVTVASDLPSGTGLKETREPKGQIVLCHKSKCWQAGGADLYKQLRENLETAALTDQIQLKTTGCLGHCKKAPNLLVLPQKKHWHRVSTEQIQPLIQALVASDPPPSIT